MESGEIIISQGPRRSGFQPFLIGLLEEAGIPARLVGLVHLPSNCGPAWKKTPDYEPVFVLVAERFRDQAIRLAEHTLLRCKICLRCKSFIKPGKQHCGSCGEPADPRDPDDIRAEYCKRPEI